MVRSGTAAAIVDVDAVVCSTQDELKQMDVRIGVVQHSLLQIALKKQSQKMDLRSNVGSYEALNELRV